MKRDWSRNIRDAHEIVRSDKRRKDDMNRSAFKSDVAQEDDLIS